MTDLEQKKIIFADASIALEIAQGRYNEAKQALVMELQKPRAQVTPTLPPEAKLREGEKPEVK